MPEEKPEEENEAGSIYRQQELQGNVTYHVAPMIDNLFNTLRMPPPRAVACWTTKRAFFEFDSSFILPHISPELAKLEGCVKANPGALASIFGHADPVGSDDYNKKLSGRRARAFYALLTRNVDIWEELYKNPTSGDTFGLRSIQQMLSHLPHQRGSGDSDISEVYYQGPINGLENQKMSKAVKDFQNDHKDELEADGILGPNTRKAIFRAYMDSICIDPSHQFIMNPEEFLGDPEENRSGDGKAAYQGCGEFNPILLLSQADEARYKKNSDKAERNERNAPNRRIMVLLFDQTLFFVENPKAIAELWPCPKWNEGVKGCKAQFYSDGEERRKPGPEERRYEKDRRTMACRWYHGYARKSPCEGKIGGSTDGRIFSVRLHDDSSKPLSEVAEYWVLLPGQAATHGTTNAKGWARTQVSPGYEKVTIKWQHRGKSYERELIVDCDAGNENQQAIFKLHNIGYRSNVFDFELASMAFQRDYAIEGESGLTEAGTLPPKTKERLWRIYYGEGDAKKEDICDATPPENV